ncbi:MAG: RNA 2',3'-cyclic phosphodiesterase [Rhizobiaceae bacterium]
MPRLFTGIEIPQSIRDTLALKQSGLPNVRWINPSDFHLTLRFIGDVNHGTANEIVEILHRRKWSAPYIRIGELRSFGGKKPTAIFASVDADPNLSRLVQNQENIMQGLGLPPDSRRFTPHVTIGRCKNLSPAALAQYLSHSGFAAPNMEFTPNGFVLFSARDSRGGGPYRVEESWKFDRQQELVT